MSWRARRTSWHVFFSILLFLSSSLRTWDMNWVDRSTNTTGHLDEGFCLMLLSSEHVWSSFDLEICLFTTYPIGINLWYTAAHTDCFHHFGWLDPFATFRALSQTDMHNLRKCISRVKARHLALGAPQMARASDGWQQRQYGENVQNISKLVVGIKLSEDNWFITKTCKVYDMPSLDSWWFMGFNSCLFLQASHLDSSLFLESTTRSFERNPYLSFTCTESQVFGTTTAQDVIQLAAFANKYSWTFDHTVLLV